MWNLPHLMKLLLVTQLLLVVFTLPGSSSSLERNKNQLSSSSSLLLADAFPLQLTLNRATNPNHVKIHAKKPFTALTHRGNDVNVNVNMNMNMNMNANINSSAILSIRGGGRKSNLQMKMLPPDVNAITTTFNNAPMTQSFTIFSCANLLGYIVSLVTGSHLHLDLIGTGAFALASLPTLISSDMNMNMNIPRIMVSSAAVTVWGTKLASFLFYRALQVKHDARLDETLSTVSGTTGFWVISLLWGIICSLPHTLGTTSSNPGSPITLTIGTVMYVLGLVTESLADYQKFQFKNQNPGKFCNVGLWSISQHPNFFGNLLLWFGIFIMNADSLIVTVAGAQSSSLSAEASGAGGGISGILSTLWESRRVAIALLSPLFMWTLFNGQATGSFANSVELANAKYGKDPSYQSYVENVPLIIPNLLAWLKKLLPL